MQVEDLVFVIYLWFPNFTSFITCRKISEFEMLQVVLTWHPRSGMVAVVGCMTWTAGLAWPGEPELYKMRWYHS